MLKFSFIKKNPMIFTAYFSIFHDFLLHGDSCAEQNQEAVKKTKSEPSWLACPEEKDGFSCWGSRLCGAASSSSLW
jgi:hypothetical protein